MLKKGVQYTVIPTSLSAIPDWLLENHEGKLPALVHKETVVTDPLTIAEYIEAQFPQSSLTRHGVFSYQEVLEKTIGFMPALTEYILNKDTERDEALAAVVDAQLDVMDEILRSTPGQYFCGIDCTLADLYLTPLLFHAMTTVSHFKRRDVLNFEGDPVRPALEAFMMRMFESAEFNNKKAYYNVDQVVNGWKIARGDA
jgi:glutathione S-transferase